MQTRILCGGMLATLALGGVHAPYASASTVTLLDYERHVSARMIVHNDATTQTFSYDELGAWKQVAQVVVDDRVRARAVELSTIDQSDGVTILRSRNRVGIESRLDVSPLSVLEAAVPRDIFPGTAFGESDPYAAAPYLRLAGTAETWFNVVFRVHAPVAFILTAFGDNGMGDSLGVESIYRVSLSSTAGMLFDLNSDLVSGYQGPARLDGILAPGDYTFRIFAGIAGQDLLKIPVAVDGRLVLRAISSGGSVVPTPVAAAIALPLLLGVFGRRQRVSHPTER